MKLAIFLQHKILYLALLLLFLLSFNLNIFGAEVGLNTKWFDNFDPSSEEMTHRTIGCAAKGDYKGNIVNINPPGKDYCDAYPSQFGLQGYLYGKLGEVFPSQGQQYLIIQMAQFALTILMSLLLLLFVGFAHQRYGAKVAVLVAFMLMMSVWLIGFANQMYWVTFVFFLPFIASLYLYPSVRGDSRKMITFYILLTILFLLKFLNGYEYLVATALSAVAPIVYWEFTERKIDYKKIIQRALIVIACSIIGFVIALMMHTVSLINDYGSLDGALSAIRGRGEARSISRVKDAFPVALYNFIDMQPEVYQMIDTHKDMDVLYDGKANPLVYIVIMITSYLLLPVIALPVDIHGIVDVILESFIFWVTLAFVTIGWLKRKEVFTSIEARAFYWLLTIGLLGVVSWHLLFTEHAFVHAHMVGISYYMPLMLWVYLLVAITLATLFSRSDKGVRRHN